MKKLTFKTMDFSSNTLSVEDKKQIVGGRMDSNCMVECWCPGWSSYQMVPMSQCNVTINGNNACDMGFNEDCMG